MINFNLDIISAVGLEVQTPAPSQVVNNAIPADWKPSTVFESNVNFSI
jgi:hypothetical protein